MRPALPPGLRHTTIYRTSLSPPGSTYGKTGGAAWVFKALGRSTLMFSTRLTSS